MLQMIKLLPYKMQWANMYFCEFFSKHDMVLITFIF